MMMPRKKFLLGLGLGGGLLVGARPTAAVAATSTVVSKTGNYTLTPGDEIVLVSNAASTAHMTLPTAVGITGKRYSIVKTNPFTAIYACDINTTAGQTISGQTTRSLSGIGECVSVVSDGTNWHLVDGNQEQFRTGKEWFVRGPITSTGSGRSPRTAFVTFAEAIAAATGGDTIYICDDISEDIVLSKAVSVVGLGNQRIIQGATNTANSVVVKVTSQNAQISNLDIRGGTNYVGTHLLIDGGSRSSFRQLTIGPPAGTTPTAYPTSAGAGAGIGGIGIATNNCEGLYFEDIKITRCSIGLVIGQESSSNELNRCVMSTCYQDIVAGLATSVGLVATVLPAPWAYGGGNGGGWTIISMKDTNPVGSPAVPVVDFIGDGTPNYVGANNGQNVFVGVEFSESSYVTTARFGSTANTFIRPVSAPATVWLIEGQGNDFVNARILGAGWVVNSDRNQFDRGWSNGVITGAGSHNRFKGVLFGQGPALALQMTGSDNNFDSDCTFSGVAGGQHPSGLAVLGVRPKFQRDESVVPLTYGSNVTVDLRQGTHYTLDITNSNGWTLANPIDTGNANTANIMVTKQITVELRNAASYPGAITLGSKWKLAGGKLAPPVAGTRTVLTAMFNGTDYVEMSRVTGIAA